MRARLVILVLAILAVAGFAAQNWAEFNRVSPLTFGVITEQASLGLIMLTLLGIALVAFLVSSIVQQTRHLVDTRHHVKELERQRDLADRAEASRFTELRQHLDLQLKELRQRDAIAATELEKSVVSNQRELRHQLEAMNRLLTSRLSEIESRLTRHADAPVLTERRDHLNPGDVRRERV